MTIYLLEIAAYVLVAFGIGVALENLTALYKRRQQMRLSFPNTEHHTDHRKEHEHAMVG